MNEQAYTTNNPSIVLTQIQTFLNSVSSLDQYISSFKPLNHQQELLKHRQIRLAAFEYIQLIEQKIKILTDNLDEFDFQTESINECKQQFMRLKNAFLELNKKAQYLIEKELLELAEPKDPKNKCINYDYLAHLEDAYSIHDSWIFDSVYIFLHDNHHLGMLIFYDHKHFYIDSENYSFDDLINNIDTHINSNTMWLTNTAIKNVNILKEYQKPKELDNIISEESANNDIKNKETNEKIITLSIEDKKNLDFYIKRIISGNIDLSEDNENIEWYCNKIIDHTYDPDKAAAYYKYIEYNINKKLSGIPLNINIKNIFGTFILYLVNSAIKPGFQDNYTRINLFLTALTGILTLSEFVGSKKATNKHRENLLENLENMKYLLLKRYEYQNISERHFEEKTSINIQNKNGKIRNIRLYNKPKDKYKLMRNKYIKHTQDHDMKITATAVALAFSCISSIVGAYNGYYYFKCDIKEPHAHQYLYNETNFSVYSTNHFQNYTNFEVQDNIIFPETQEEYFVYNQSNESVPKYTYIKDNLEALAKVDLADEFGKVGDYYFTYEYFKKDINGEYSTDYSLNPDEARITGRIRLEYKTYIGYNIEYDEKGNYVLSAPIEFASYEDLISKAEIVDINKTTTWITKVFDRDKLAFYFDKNKCLKNKSAFDIPAELMAQDSNNQAYQKSLS